MDVKTSIINKLDEIEKSMGQTDNFSTEQLSLLDKGLASLIVKLDKSNSPVNKTMPTETDGTILIWSDGACTGNPGPGGWGTVILSSGEYLEFSGYSPHSTNNIMEMTAALEGIKQTPEGAEIVLTTDSQYVLKGITQWIKGWKKKGWKKANGEAVMNQELWRNLDAECQIRNIKWEWVRGHTGHPQNERCDELARQAITES